MKEDEEFCPQETEEVLESLYRPEGYEEAVELCLEILEEIAADWQPAKLYLMLSLAGQDLSEEALPLVDELDSEVLLEALDHLAFGAGTKAETELYKDICACFEERGESEKLEEFLKARVTAMARQDLGAFEQAWES